MSYATDNRSVTGAGYDLHGSAAGAQLGASHANAVSQLGLHNVGMGANCATQPPSGLMVDAASVMARMSDIRDRIVRLNDRLNGYRPTDGCETKVTPHEPDTMRRWVDRSMTLAMEIEVELNVIEAKL